MYCGCFQLINKVWFLSRVADRLISNVDELCEATKQIGLGSFVDIIDDMDFCKQVELAYMSDIIVSVSGSQNCILSYSKPGSVHLIVHPFNRITAGKRLTELK